MCPGNGFPLPYDVRADLKYDPTVAGYTCSSHPWINAQHQLGKTNCRMVLMYNKDFSGYDIPMAQGWGWGPYNMMLDQCRTYPCVAALCHGTGTCYLKNASHLTIPVSLNNQPDTYYWYTVCN
ncbi:uncharacterized protein [Cherax quadricarinatus]|uniref:uncharacterized protein n=1 Tax=Cherax quadricarinatus TaxID=27406 RepID=UPI00387EDBA3